jgi:hypothetical protein
MTDHPPDLTNATPGDPPPVRIGTVWCSTPFGPRMIPLYAEWPGGVSVDGVGVVTDLLEGWVVDRVEPDAPPTPAVTTAEQRIAAAAAALAQLDGISAPVLSVDVLDVLVDVRSALEA